jgi:hypothetical protein
VSILATPDVYILTSGAVRLCVAAHMQAQVEESYTISLLTMISMVGGGGGGDAPQMQKSQVSQSVLVSDGGRTCSSAALSMVLRSAWL